MSGQEVGRAARPLVIVVGVGPGISRAIAFLAGEAGTAVGLIARREIPLKALTLELAEHGIPAIWRCADAGNPKKLKQAIAELVNEAGPCAGLVYNAAEINSGFALDIYTEQLEKEFSVNVSGALAATQAVAPSMISAGRGSIVFTGGGLALEPFPEWTSLALGKAALRSLALSLYKELAPYGVHVSVVTVCGIVATGGPFDPVAIAREYVRLLTAPNGISDREIIIQPEGTDPFYNDPDKNHRSTSVLPPHAH